MSENKPKLSIKLKRGGQKVKHGGYSFMTKSEIPANRKHILIYLTAARENLVRDLGPTEGDLTAAQIIIIDRVVSKLGVVRCIEEHIRENSVMVGQRVAPALRETYLAYNNSIRLDLTALGIKERTEGKVMAPFQIAEAFDKEKETEKRIEQ